MSKSENSHRKGLPPSMRRRGSSLPRKKPSPDRKHITGESPIKSRKKGSKPPKQAPEDLVLEEASVGMPGGEFTLLPIPTRKPLPGIPKRPGRKCLLEEIVNYNPELYAKLIGLIRNKVSANVAALRVGINESTFWDWSGKGGEDASNGIDSYFSRFHEDIRRAVAYAVAESEQAVNEKSPERYLQHGMGRIFGVGKQKNRKGELPGPQGQGMLPAPQSMEEAIDATFVVTRTSPSREFEDGIDDSGLPDGEGEGGTRSSVGQGSHDGRNGKTIGMASGSAHGIQTLPLSPTQEAEALGVLSSIGQIAIDPDQGVITLSDALKKALQDQVSK